MSKTRCLPAILSFILALNVISRFPYAIASDATGGQPSPQPALEGPRVDILFFYSTGCPHCRAEREFLKELEIRYPSLVIHEFEISETGNARLLTDLAAACGEKPRSVPVLFVDQKMLTGFLGAETTGQDIERSIRTCLETGCEDPRKTLPQQPYQGSNPCEADGDNETSPPTLAVPILGPVDLSRLSLPALTILLGIVDGFNPCAMWALMFLLALLINTKSRKNMWLIGGIFILTSGIVYFLFMTAWLNFFLLVGLVDVTRIVIGILAIAAGYAQLRSYFSGEAETCRVNYPAQRTVVPWTRLRQSALNRIKAIVQPATLPATLLGIVILASTVNLIELFCSLGLPAIYTRTLSLHHLPTLVYYAYIALYVLFFILDDLSIFLIATITLTSTTISTKYSKYATLVGGLLILSLGFILILKPELLMR